MHTDGDSTRTIYDLRPGELVGNRFRIIRLLGRGGMGQVFEAEDTATSRRPRVALKVIRPELASTPQARESFEREVEIGKTITHENVCRIHDLGHHFMQVSGADPVVFVTMELLDGETLSASLRRGPIPLDDALLLAGQVCAALDAAHRKQLIHRDLKPGNVMLVRSGDNLRAVVTDFGLAQSVRQASEQTQSGVEGGTPDYMSPEQVRRENLDARSDIYSLGLLLYEIVTGKLPFTGATAYDRMLRRLDTGPTPPTAYAPHLDPVWEAVILRCLERNPNDRFPSAIAVAEGLRNEKAQRAGRARSRLIPLGVAAVLIGSGIGCAWLTRDHPSVEEQHWYLAGIGALRSGTYLTAMKCFDRATEIDNSYRLAHARSAEAAAELEYSAKARSEIFAATPPDRIWPLWPSDRLLLRAVYLTVNREYPRALQAYRALMFWAARSEQPGLLVDMGRLYEASQNTSAAISSYEKAEQLEKQYAAPAFRLGVLYRRLGRLKEASRELDKAAQAYQLEGSAEGIAQVLYQRALILSKTGNPGADPLLHRVLQMAENTGNENLQIQALLELGYVSYSRGANSQATTFTNQALDLAERKGTEALAASALVDVANRSYIAGNDDIARNYATEALEIAERLGALRVRAGALICLSGVQLRRGDTKGALESAREAFTFFTQGGYRLEAERAVITVASALMQANDLAGATTLLRPAVATAAQADDHEGAALCNTFLGLIATEYEDYPRALALYSSSIQQAEKAGNTLLSAYAAVDRAEMQWKLGRYTEAGSSFGRATNLAKSGDANLALLASISVMRADMELSAGRIPQARSLVDNAVTSSSYLDDETRSELKRIRCSLESAAGNASAAAHFCEEAVRESATGSRVAEALRARLALAENQLLRQQAGDALASAGVIVHTATEAQLPVTEFMAAILGRRAAIAAGDAANAKEFGSVAGSASQQLVKKWGDKAAADFMNRPDVRSASAFLRRAR